jgi:hypothetical protein
VRPRERRVKKSNFSPAQEGKERKAKGNTDTKEVLIIRRQQARAPASPDEKGFFLTLLLRHACMHARIDLASHTHHVTGKEASSCCGRTHLPIDFYLPGHAWPCGRDLSYIVLLYSYSLLLLCGGRSCAVSIVWFVQGRRDEI